MRIGTINSNTFQDEAYKFGSLASRDPRVRRQDDRTDAGRPVSGDGDAS